MGDAGEQGRIDYPTYLTIEQAADRKHEWFDGRVSAMAARACCAHRTLGELPADASEVMCGPQHCPTQATLCTGRYARHPTAKRPALNPPLS